MSYCPRIVWLTKSTLISCRFTLISPSTPSCIAYRMILITCTPSFAYTNCEHNERKCNAAISASMKQKRMKPDSVAQCPHQCQCHAITRYR
ncbi:hypothetical protein T4D_2628 [Trichinella pseudospiralis]|uniref:Uncharacterized protein n=1 Tax=Trichinella pseudospiralis TaxID=6337 RepID=A0A0V1F635_TRIPS|nr:hypothetical protein T4D_2628 [Trichinella pseudospiralis]